MLNIRKKIIQGLPYLLLIVALFMGKEMIIFNGELFIILAFLIIFFLMKKYLSAVITEELNDRASQILSLYITTKSSQLETLNKSLELQNVIIGQEDFVMGVLWTIKDYNRILPLLERANLKIENEQMIEREMKSKEEAVKSLVAKTMGRLLLK